MGGGASKTKQLPDGASSPLHDATRALYYRGAAASFQPWLRFKTRAPLFSVDWLLPPLPKTTNLKIPPLPLPPPFSVSLSLSLPLPANASRLPSPRRRPSPSPRDPRAPRDPRGAPPRAAPSPPRALPSTSAGRPRFCRGPQTPRAQGRGRGQGRG
jgi:hypothetical protein